MFGNPTWSTLAHLSSICWTLNDKYSGVITRNGPVTQILKDISEAVKIYRFSHRQVNKDSINPLTARV